MEQADKAKASARPCTELVAVEGIEPPTRGL